MGLGAGPEGEVGRYGVKGGYFPLQSLIGFFVYVPYFIYYIIRQMNLGPIMGNFILLFFGQ